MGKYQTFCKLCTNGINEIKQQENYYVTPTPNNLNIQNDFQIVVL